MRPQDFWKEMNRMCESRGKVCAKTGRELEVCPPLWTTLCHRSHKPLREVTAEDFAAAYAYTEKWSDAHPKSTRQDEFLKIYPNARIHPYTGALTILPCEIDGRLTRVRCEKFSRCQSECEECAAGYWKEKVE